MIKANVVLQDFEGQRLAELLSTVILGAVGVRPALLESLGRDSVVNNA